MNTKLTRSITTLTAVLIVTSAFAQQPPPPGSQPPPTGVQPPPTGVQPPPTGVQPPPTSVQPPPTGVQPPPTGVQPPPPGNQPPPNGNQPPPPPAQTAAPRIGAPLTGLTAEQLASFNDGRADFVMAERPNTGLGPIFNNVSCVSCHRGPAPGGSSRINVTRFGLTTADGFDPLADLGGSLLQLRAIAPAAREHIPAQANTVALRQTTPLFGLGLIEAIPDDTIRALADRPEVDGVKGRAAEVVDIATGELRVGRFGWKNQHATLLSFSADAYLNEMGITNRFFSTENAPNGDAALLARFDRVADPEDRTNPNTGLDGVDRLTNFQRLLAPPVARALTANGTAGRALFTTVGCAQCHVPNLQTGSSDIAALSNQSIALYSDLLLHDMGTLGDGIPQADAGPNEFRTPPLWGLSTTAPYLHDGRAGNVDRAIRAHAGEGNVARQRYEALTNTQRAQLLEFLRSL